MAGRYRQKYINLVNQCKNPNDLQPIIDAKGGWGTAECTMIRQRLSEFATRQPLPLGTNFANDYDLNTFFTVGTAYGSHKELDDTDVKDLQTLAIAKKASLLKERALTQTITGLTLTDVTTNTAGYVSLNAYAPPGLAATPAAKLLALGTAGFDTTNLREEDAVRLDALVIAKKASLLKEQALTQTITGLTLTDVTTNTADYQHLHAYATPLSGTAADKLLALGTAGFDTASLREEDAVRLDALVIAKKASLLKEQALTQTITGLTLTDVTTNTANYQHLNAYVTPGSGTAADKLLALGTAGFDTTNLRKEDAVRLDALVIAKKASLLKERALTQTITGLTLTDVTTNTANYQHLHAYATPLSGTAADKLLALGTAGFDTASLREEDAVRLDALVIAKKASLLKEQALTQTITGLTLTDVTTNTAGYVSLNAYAPPGLAATPAAKLLALGTAGFDTTNLREEDAVRLDALVIAKKASLLKERALTQTITGLTLTDVTTNTADYQHLHAYATPLSGTAADKLLALGTAGFDTASLREEDAVRLDALVIAKKASLLKEQALTQTITGLTLTDVTTNTADYQHLHAYATPLSGTAADKLLALGTAGFDTASLREEDAVRLDALVIAKKASLLKEQALTQTITGLTLTDVTTNTANYQHLNAYATPGSGTAADKLLALGTAGFDTTNLRKEDAVRLDALVIAKKTSLTNAKTITDAINTNLTMSNDKVVNANILKVLRGIATAPMDTVRTKLNSARVILGNVDLSAALTTEDLLSDADARDIKKRAKEKYHFFMISEAIKKIDQPQLLARIAAAGDEDQILAEVNRQRTSWRVNQDFVRNDLSDRDWQEIKRQAGLKLAAINTKPNMADSFWQTGKDPRLQHFTDKLVTNDGTVSNPTASTVAPSTGAVGISAANPIETRYQGVKLQQGDKIESVANFPQKARGQNAAQATATGKLVQDHTGKVTDITDAVERDKMTEQEKSQMAIKQAKMLITNMKGTGEQTIFITGDDEHHADRVYAALLLMKNDLKFKIESHVPGCEGPRKRAGLELQSTVDDKFIKDKLRGYNEKALEGFKTEAKDFITNTRKSREQMSLMRDGQAGSSKDGLKVDEHLAASGKKI
ncbi:hypothetical protein [Legionella sp. PC997]|uniref:hypothetical protein n=1 Tax=Legionella sp. PC997 TaxID=2755562 RepID=UPI0015F7B0C6|nr:hypothetical protein [Legionella sp. PC997]QMT59295.1 hypothetical protein HBNCFIEN_00657 [Legionella sp. PC997]